MDEKLSSRNTDIHNLIVTTINQLTELVLLESGSKFSLPIDHITLRPRSQEFEPIKMNLYDLEIQPYGLRPKAKVTLNSEVITSFLDQFKTSRTPQPTWSFMGFIKDRPITLNNITSGDDLWALADLHTQHSGVFTLKIPQGAIFSGYFFIMIENDEKLRFEDETRITIEAPNAPSIAEISELKSKLNALIADTIRKKESSDHKNFEEENKKINEFYENQLKIVTESNKDDHQKENDIERINRNWINASAALVDKFQYKNRP